MSTHNRRSDADDAHSGLSRREFFGVGALGIGAMALAAARTARADVDRHGRTHVTVRTKEWYGDDPMTLTFPAGWDVHVQPMAGHDDVPLTDDEIRAALASPVGSPRIADLADGRETACITFDDLTRPTSAHRVMPFIIEELNAAGIRDENIIFQGSYGTHAAMSQMDMTAKLGADIVQRYMVWNHDPYSGNVSVGTTSFGTEVKLNRRFVEADVKITVSGLKPHGMAGYGGGAKAVLPGVADMSSIVNNHEHVHPNSRPRAAKAFLGSNTRKDMEEAAKMVENLVSVNLVANGSRQVTGLVCGDVVEAHHEGVRRAHPRYATEVLESPDIVISNAYPQANEASKELDFARMSLREGGSAVLIQDSPAGQRKIHYLGWKVQEEHSNRRRRRHGLPVGQAQQVIIFNRYHAKWDEMDYSEDVQFVRSWDEVIERLARVHGDGSKVAVYPTSPYQHGPMELRM